MRWCGLSLSGALGAAIGLGAGLAVLAEDTGAEYTPEFGAKVRQYLMDHPEVIIEAITALEESRAAAQMAEKAAPVYRALRTAGADLWIGAPDAPYVLIEFFDYRCEVCKAMQEDLTRLVRLHPEIAVLKRHLPIISPGSERAARYVIAADAAYGPEAAAHLHAALYATGAPLREEVLRSAAERLGLDHSRIEEAQAAPEADEIIARNRDFAIALEIRGTPTFLGPEGYASGRLSLEELRALAKP